MGAGKQVFVLDVADEPTFAFEADGMTAAAALVQLPWFTSAVTGFRARRGKVFDSNDPLFARMATEAEASLYRGLADEFADATGCFLVAHLADPGPVPI
jgi:hypothetical protein